MPHPSPTLFPTPARYPNPTTLMMPDSCLITEHSYGGRVSTNFGCLSQPTLSTFRHVRGKNLRLKTLALARTFYSEFGRELYTIILHSTPRSYCKTSSDSKKFRQERDICCYPAKCYFCCQRLLQES